MKFIEDAVMTKLIDLFDDQAQLIKSMSKKIPNAVQAEKLEKEIRRYEKKLQGIAVERSRLIDKVAKGVLKDKEIRPNMADYEKRERVITEQLDASRSKLDLFVSRKDIKERVFIITAKNWRRYMKPAEQRRLLQELFAGLAPDGSRLGIYVGKRKGKWYFRIVGLFGDHGPFGAKKDYKQSEVNYDPPHRDPAQDAGLRYPPGSGPFAHPCNRS